jgi:hypothetical protein
MKLPDLHDLLKYTNPRALKVYTQNYPNNTLPAEQALEELLKYLWLAHKHGIDQQNDPENEALQFRCVMLQSMREIDEMWHEFILHTRDYTDFCNHYFAEYVHHQPNVFENLPVSSEEAADETEKMLPYVYDHLGEQTLRVWYANYINASNN